MLYFKFLQETLTKTTCLGDYQNSENGLHGIYTTPVQMSGASFYTANWGKYLDWNDENVPTIK